jgi:hypothetical protein
MLLPLMRETSMNWRNLPCCFHAPWDLSRRILVRGALVPGRHRDPSRPGYRTFQEYRQRAEEILNNSNATVTEYSSNAPLYAGETHLQLGDELLRLDPQGVFRSLYPLW